MRALHLSVILFTFIPLLAGAVSSKAEWIPNGNPICTAMGNQQGPRLVSDGHGGAIIAWTDYRNGNSDIYAQRVDAFGNTRWVTNGVEVCTAQENQYGFRIVSDGLNGAIITWMDNRSDIMEDIYAQRVDAFGNVQWMTDGVAICIQPDRQRFPSIVTDCSGGAIVTWFDERSNNLDYYAQRVDLHGQPRWEVNGIYICGTVWPLPCYPSVISDSSGGLIMAWTSPGGIYDFDISATRFDSLGAVQWRLKVCEYYDTQFNTTIVTDGAGGAIVAWADNRDCEDNLPIYAQRIDAAGNGLWVEDGIPLYAVSYAYDSHAMIPDGTNGAIITWVDISNYVNSQKVDSSGALHWTAGGVNTGAGTERQMCSDESGGLLLAWGNEDIVAARIYENGVHAWERTICDADGIQNSPQLIPDGEGGALIAWQDQRDGEYDIYVSRINPDGEIPVATLLRSYDLYTDNSGITIEWKLYEIDADAQFIVLRAESGNCMYNELANPYIQRDGLSFIFTDMSCERGITYRYRVDVSGGIGCRVLFESEPISLPPLTLALFQNYPNPFNPSTTINYRIPENTMVSLEVYDNTGRRIACLVKEEQFAGDYAIQWRGIDTRGNSVSSGVYFYRIMAGKQTITRKMVLLR